MQFTFCNGKTKGWSGKTKCFFKNILLSMPSIICSKDLLIYYFESHNIFFFKLRPQRRRFQVRSISDLLDPVSEVCGIKSNSDLVFEIWEATKGNISNLMSSQIVLQTFQLTTQKRASQNWHWGFCRQSMALGGAFLVQMEIFHLIYIYEYLHIYYRFSRQQDNNMIPCYVFKKSCFYFSILLPSSVLISILICN